VTVDLREPLAAGAMTRDGCETAIALRDLGFDAKFMTGGHSAWKAIDGPSKLPA
jgi:hypothetical protein